MFILNTSISYIWWGECISIDATELSVGKERRRLMTAIEKEALHGVKDISYALLYIPCAVCIHIFKIVLYFSFFFIFFYSNGRVSRKRILYNIECMYHFLSLQNGIGNRYFIQWFACDCFSNRRMFHRRATFRFPFLFEYFKYACMHSSRLLSSLGLFFSLNLI